MPYDPYAQFDDIGKQPLSLEGFENRALLRIGAVSPYVLGAVYRDNELYHIWLHLAQHGGGVKAMTSVWDQIKGQRSFDLNAVEMCRVYDYATHQHIEQLDLTPRKVMFPREVLTLHKDEQDFISMATRDVVMAHFGDMRSRMEDESAQFILLFRAEDSVEERYRQLFQHLIHRTFVPYLPEWMPQMWKWLRATKRILECRSFGPYVGWKVSLLEDDIRDYVIDKMRPGQIFSIKKPAAERELVEAA